MDGQQEVMAFWLESLTGEKSPSSPEAGHTSKHLELDQLENTRALAEQHAPQPRRVLARKAEDHVYPTSTYLSTYCVRI